LGAAAWLLQNAAGSSAQPQSSDVDHAALQSATRTSWALGSEVSMTALHERQDVARDAVDAAFAELELVEELMSIYRPHSQLCRLNRDGVLDNPHPYFIEVLRHAQTVSQRSDGAFDITVQPLWSLYAEAKKAAALPDPEAVAVARQQVDWRRVEISSRQIRLRGEGTAITLNGIAQGYAADRAIAAIRSWGVVHALVNTGEIGALGDKADGDRWTVGIQHPRHENAYISLAKLADRCLATTGDYATTFSGDFRFNHVFDPRSGRSPDELASVSVAAPTAMQADAFSTAVFVLGPERGLELVRTMSGADAYFVLKDGRTLVTENFPVAS
jgi:thiamine biosynthesis lipoprotein